MAGFTFIDGSTQSSAGWDRVAALLRGREHDVVTTDLPKNEPAWTLRDYAERIAAQASRTGPRVIIAHSFGGVFLPLVADSADVLVFEAALIPEPRKSVRDQFIRDPSMLLRDWVAAGVRWFDPGQHEAIAREFLFHDCDAATVDWALTTVEMFNTRNLITEASPIDHWPSVRCEYILCTEDRTIDPEWSRKTALQRFGRAPIEIPGGHAPHVSRPAVVAEVLERLAKTAGSPEASFARS